ncbi:MAG: hypothetical protein R3A52_05135 [Polyangiales bacterium]
MKRALALAALLSAVGCYADPYVPPDDDVGVDAGEFSLCTPACRAGQVCVSFRCVAAIDAGESGLGVDVGVDAGPACCPIEAPSCGCVYVGGSTRAGFCARVCGEGAPSLWVRSRDTYGCERWTTSGKPCVDAGFDVGLDLGADEDAGEEGDAPDAGGSMDASDAGDDAAEAGDAGDGG